MARDHRMNTYGWRAAAVVRLALLLTALCRTSLAQDIKIPQSTFTLSNGLTVVISEDHSTPNVAVELWLRAGSRYEDRGRWGEAHFCEHLLGATRIPPLPGRILDGNAQTRRDFTRYYALVAREALEYIVALQADRLDYPLEAMTAKRLADNREIVINEYRTLNHPPASARGIHGGFELPPFFPWGWI